MQTFLPYPDFWRSVEVLDNKRLGKQRVEAIQILRALTTGSGWKHHPAVLMWKGFVPALAEYGITCCLEWRQRGFQDSTQSLFYPYLVASPVALPPWFGNDRFHLSHQSNLLRKDPAHYGHHFTCPDDLPYVWPTKEAF